MSPLSPSAAEGRLCLWVVLLLAALALPGRAEHPGLNGEQSVSAGQGPSLCAQTTGTAGDGLLQAPRATASRVLLSLDGEQSVTVPEVTRVDGAAPAPPTPAAGNRTPAPGLLSFAELTSDSDGIDTQSWLSLYSWSVRDFRYSLGFGLTRLQQRGFPDRNGDSFTGRLRRPLGSGWTGELRVSEVRYGGYRPHPVEAFARYRGPGDSAFTADVRSGLVVAAAGAVASRITFDTFHAEGRLPLRGRWQPGADVFVRNYSDGNRRANISPALGYRLRERPRITVSLRQCWDDSRFRSPLYRSPLGFEETALVLSAEDHSNTALTWHIEYAPSRARDSRTPTALFHSFRGDLYWELPSGNALELGADYLACPDYRYRGLEIGWTSRL